MKENYIHVVFVIDESGSMASSTDDVIGGFENYIKDQKNVAEGKCSVSLFKFSSKVEEVYLGKDVADVNGIEYNAHGLTAMNDGIGTAIDKVGEWLNSMTEDEKPSKNIVVIMTDGQENFSHDYTLSEVKEMISHQESKYNWSFIYMGTDLTSLDDAKALGISLSSVSSRKDYAANYQTISKLNTAYRCASSQTEAESAINNLSTKLDEVTCDYFANLNNKS